MGFLLLALVLPLSGQRPSREAELASIREEIARLSGELTAARSKVAGLRNELAEANLNLRLAETRLAEAEAARDLAAWRVEEGEREVVRLTAALGRAKEGLERSLSGLYRLGRQGYLRLLFSLEPGQQLLPSIRLLRYVARRDRQAIGRYEQAREKLESERRDLVARREETERWIRQERMRRRQLAAVREQKARLFAQAEQESGQLALRAEELVDKEKKLSALLDALAGGAEERLAGTPMQEFRGVLDWPIEARVAVGFGPRLDPRYKTRVPHNGIDLTTDPGAGIRVVFPGKVLFAAPFSGYGNTVVVQHPGRVFSLYAGLSELRVTKEGMLSLGDPVGLSSDKLYFEIRVENRPEDPLKWLR